MAGEAEQLVVSLEARIREFERNFQRANRVANDNFRSIENRARTAGRNLESAMASSTTGMSRSLDQFGAAASSKLKGAFAAVAAGVSLNELRKAADDYTKIMNGLKVAGVKDGDLSKTFDALFASAQRNAVPLDALAQLYSRVSQAQTTLKASSQDILKVTDIVAQSLRVSGKSASESSGALLQLAQAFSNGKVQAEEYNSLLDGAYPLLQAAAAGMKEAGGDVAKLTALVKDGKVSSEAFFRAIEAGAPLLEEKLSGAALTTEQAMSRMSNEFIKAVGEFDKATGASAALASGMGSVAASIGPIGQAATDATLKVQGLIKSLGDLMAVAGRSITSALESAQQGTANTQRTILEAKLRGAIGPERTGIESQLRALDAGPQNSSAKAARAADERAAFIAAGKSAGDFGNIPTPQSLGGDGSTDAPRLSRFGAPKPATIKPISLKDYAVPGDDKAGGGGGGSADKKSRFDREIEAIQRRTEALKNEADMVGKGRFEVEKSKIALQLEQAVKRDGVAISDEMRTAIDAAATGYANAKLKVEDLKAALDGARDAQKFFGQELTDGFIDMVIEGKSATEVVQNLGKALLKASLQAALMGSGPLAGLFGTKGADGAVGGLFGLLFKGVTGFSEGGYTGDGGKYQPAGLVHRGEYVVPAKAVTRIGIGRLDAISSGLPGFADGGLVGAIPQGAPALPSTMGVAANTNTAVAQTVNVHVNAQGGDPKQNRDLADQIGKRVQQELRGMIGEEMKRQTRPNGMLREALGR